MIKSVHSLVVTTRKCRNRATIESDLEEENQE